MTEEIAISTSWHSYPSIYALGHKALTELFLDPVIVEEKVDGSQFSFGRFGGELKCRSKGAQLNVIAPEKMFKTAVDVAGSLPLRDGWTYRAEYLLKPKHNSLAYERIPKNHLILFDINTGHERYYEPEYKKIEAARLDLEVVPTIWNGPLADVSVFRGFLDNISILGGQKIEGVVVKNYSRFGPDKKALMGKFVSEEFKEVHAAEWRKENPNRGDIIETLVAQYRTPARFRKAAQHLQERGKLEGSPRDIGLLIEEAKADIEKECAEEIKTKLYEWAVHKVLRGASAGLPAWYKEELLKQQFSATLPNAGDCDNASTQAPGSTPGGGIQ